MNFSEINNKLSTDPHLKKLNGSKTLAIIPDYTRSFEMGHFFKSLVDISIENGFKLDFLIANGTHPAMNEEQICKHFEITSEDWNDKYSDTSAYNHVFNDDNELKVIGEISSEKVIELSSGKVSDPIKVEINKRVFDYDNLLIIGPVFPHEVVGFSGGNKYLFPGIGGAEIINKTHWLGAVITNYEINGVKDTPVRQLINTAAEFLDIPIIAIKAVMRGKELIDFFVGDVFEAWNKAVDLTATINIKKIDRKYKTVIGIASPMYDELWTCGKVMYKLEPIVEDGGELIIYAPELRKVSDVHGKYIEEVGYHTIEYILAKYDELKHIPGGILAHSSHVKGTGKYENGVETPRIKVTLATSISKEMCEKINLGFMDFNKIDLNDYKNKEDEGILCVENAGEVLYRQK